MWFDALRQYAAVGAAALAHERVQPRRPPRNRDELAFLPAALEIIETPPSPLGRAISWSIMLFLSAAVAWASFGQLDIHATAQGQIIPRGKTKVVQPPEPGVVREIHVRDGDTVEAGRLLVLLDQTAAAADVSRLAREREEALASVARLRAQLDGRDRLEAPPGVSLPVLRVHELQLQARLKEQRALIDGLMRESEQKQAERDALRAELAGLEQTIPLLREILDMRAVLEKSGSGSKLQLLQARESLIDKSQALASTRARLIQAHAAIAAATERLVQAEEQFRADALRELAEAERQAQTISADHDKAAQRHKLLELRAPVDGVVQQLAVHAPGAVVGQAQAVLSLVPLNEGVDAEVMLANKDIGFVQEEQAVELKIETFPFTRYGTVLGRVKTVSRDAIALQTQARGGSAGGAAAADPAGGTVYAVRVEPLGSLMVDGRAVALTPGMAVTAEIKTGERRVIEYLLTPLLRYRDESWRER